MRLFVKSKKAAAVISVILTALCLHGCSAAEPPAKAEMAALYGENRTVEGRYDIETAVKCENGVFLGRTDGDVISFKGIPYAKAPVGE
ncbi:MAG: hypothetical protein IK085_01950, partial [Clostridia bacterium]|nr:hypothetical protein [Clostridia bacterium]